MADGEGDGTFSFQEATMTVEDRDFLAANVSADDEKQQGLRSGWESERVSGNEIRERLSALIKPSSSAIAIHASDGSGGAEDDQSSTGSNLGQSSLWHDTGRNKAFSKDGRAALEDRSGDFNSSAGNDTWGGLMGGRSLSKVEASLDLNEAEQLFAASPLNARHVAQPLGLVSCSRQGDLSWACFSRPEPSCLTFQILL